MKKFLYKSLSYLLAFILFYVLLVSTIALLNKTIDSDCNITPDNSYLIIGDSHIMWGINDEFIENAQNIALNAEGYIYSYAKLKHLLEERAPIKKVLIGLSYHNFSDYYDDYIYGEKMSTFFSRYFDVLPLNNYVELVINNPKNLYVIGGLLVREGISSVLKNNCEYIGSFPEEKMLDPLDKVQIQRRIDEQYYYSGEICSFSEINIKYLEKIIDLCRSNDMEVIAINTPMNDGYIQLIPDLFIKKYKSFVKEYQLQTIEFDDLSLPDSCFLPDGDHLNYYGAIETSKKLNNYLKADTINLIATNPN